MRCKNCNVDLSDSYTTCPLCHSKAVDEPAFLDLPEVGFPREYKHYVIPKKTDLPVKYLIRVGVVASIILGIVSAFTVEMLWTIVVPAIMVVLGIACVISSFFEKSSLLHSLVALLSVVAFQLLFLLGTLIAGLEMKFMLIAFVVCVLLFLLVFIMKPKRAKEQLQALFCL